MSLTNQPVVRKVFAGFKDLESLIIVDVTVFFLFFFYLMLFDLAAKHGAECLFVLQLRVHVVNLKVSPGRKPTTEDQSLFNEAPD